MKNGYYHKGQHVKGIYHNVQFTGTIGEFTRQAPDYRSLIYDVVLDKPITVYGLERNRLELHSYSNEDYVEAI